MRRTVLICLALVSAAAVLPPAGAGAAPARSSAKASTPKITRVTPMRPRRCAAYDPRAQLQGGPQQEHRDIPWPDGRSAFAKPRTASRTKLVVRIPPPFPAPSPRAGHSKATRFKLRVPAGRSKQVHTAPASPVVVPAGSGADTGGGSGGGLAGRPGNDYDGDLLPNATEVGLKLDPCIADTDGDSVEDGYEYQAAVVDLNHHPSTPPLPYPGKRPYPNPLDPGDGTPAGTDYDDDGLLLREEFLLWLNYSDDGVRRGSRPQGSLGPLIYSDGQKSKLTPAPGGLLGWVSTSTQWRALRRRARR